MQKNIANLEFVQVVNIEFIDSLKNNGIKYFLIFDDSCEEIRKSNAFVDLAIAGRHWGLSTTYIKHNLFHQSRLRRDVELQITHIVHFKSPQYIMQVTILGAQLGLGSKLVDRYPDATCVPFGQFSIDLSLRTDDRLRSCKNSGSVPSKFPIPERLKHLRTLDVEHTKSVYSPSVPIAFPQMQKPLSSVLPKRVYPVSMRMHSRSTQGKLANHKKTSHGKVSRPGLVTIAKSELGSKEETFCRQKKDCRYWPSLRLPSLIICLDLDHFVLDPASVYNKSVTTQSITKQELPKYKAEHPPTYQVDSLKRSLNRKLFGTADALIDNVLSCFRISFHIRKQ